MVEKGENAYTHEEYLNELYYYCSNDTIAIDAIGNGNYKCKEKKSFRDLEDKCFASQSKGKRAPDYLKVCGEISIKGNEKNFISTSDVGQIEDGHFVDNILACKSGFALYFYLDNSTRDRTENKEKKMAMLCVTVKGSKINSKFRHKFRFKKMLYQIY